MEERQKNRYLALQARAKAMSEREERVQGRLLQMRDDRDHKLKRAAKQRAKQLQDAVRRAEELEALREEQVAQAMKERQQRWEDRHKKMQIREDQKRQERKKAKAEEARIRDRYRQHKSSLEKAVERLSMHSPGPDVSQSPT
mmetsp:Transcript_17367/g.41345  ORF Transcript_17367/g.41345 Transcript_17367/m.41345 type:complete len:142 (+) Transcript_17367:1472-1897(+)